MDNMLKLNETFQAALYELSVLIHMNAVKKGFWDGNAMNDGTAICLMHSELSEALEGLRHGNPPDQHCPQYSSVEVELADCVIRILDYAAGNNLDLGGAIIAKMTYNATRPFKHGKAF